MPKAGVSGLGRPNVSEQSTIERMFPPGKKNIQDLPLFSQPRQSRSSLRYLLTCPLLLILLWNVPMAVFWLPSISQGIAPVDMHSHTTESDGDKTPVEQIKAARLQGMHTLWITDHDMIRNISEAQALLRQAEQLGMKAHLGVEITVDWAGKEHHLLGYFPDHVWLATQLSPDMTRLQQECARVKHSRITRNENLVRWLNEVLGDGQLCARYVVGANTTESKAHTAHVNVEEVAAWSYKHADLSDASSLGRPHFNKYLTNIVGVRPELVFGPRGGDGWALLATDGKVYYGEDMQGKEGDKVEALLHSATLARRQIAFEPSPILTAISLIGKAGGRAVVAHPPTLGKDWAATFGPALGELAKAGLWGVEAFSSEISATDHEQLHSLATQYGLAETGGSDSHGTLKSYAVLGKVYRATEEGYSKVNDWAELSVGRSEELSQDTRGSASRPGNASGSNAVSKGNHAVQQPAATHEPAPRRA
eukprot:g32614.t1